MTGKIWTDPDLDDVLRGELGRMAAANPAPALGTLPAQRKRSRRAALPVLPWSAAPDRPRRLAPVALGLAAAVAFAGAGTWLGVHRLHGGVSQPAGHARPTPTPRPAPPDAGTLRSTVPAGVDVVYYLTTRDNQHDVLQAVDWLGRHVGSIDVTTAQSAIGQVVQSPNGRWLIVGNDVFSAEGSWVTRLAAAFAPVWSDDSKAVCFLEDPGEAQTQAQPLMVYRLGIGSRRLATLSRSQIIACSGRTDRVLVSTQVPTNAINNIPTAAVVAYSMSTGAVVARHDYCSPSCQRIVVYLASADGAVVYESSATSAQAVRDFPNGGRSVQMPGPVVEFSGDGSRALVEVNHGVALDVGLLSSDRGRSLDLVDTHTGQVIWARADTFAADSADDGGAVLQPAGSKIAIALDLDGGQGALQPTRLEILDLAAATTPPSRVVAAAIKGMAVGF